MNILAVDLATRTGAAFGPPSGKPVTWPVDFSKAREHGARLAQVLRWTRKMVEDLQPDLIAYEAPIGGKDTGHLLVGMAAVLHATAHDLGVRVVDYHSATVRKHFIGKAMTARDFPALSHAAAKKAIKHKVADRCRLLGWEVQDLDCADAAALWDYACSNESRAHQITTVGGVFAR